MAEHLKKNATKDRTPAASAITLDRFTTGGSMGHPVRPIGPKLLGPGPGEYRVDMLPGQDKPAWTMLGMSGKFKERERSPGPAAGYRIAEEPGSTGLTYDIHWSKPKAEDMKKPANPNNGPGSVEWWLSDPFGSGTVGTATFQLTATREQARQSSGMEKKAEPPGSAPDP